MRPFAALGAGVAATVLATAVGCAESPPQQHAPPSSSATAPSPTTALSGEPSSATGARTPVAPARRAPTVVRAEPPRAMVLPGGRRVTVRTVDTTVSGLLDVPDDVAVAGWWRGGARLGDPFGSVLVAAHVDSRTQGLGPFAELLKVGRGARLVVESAGLRQTYAVRSRRLVPQGDLVDDSWLFAVTGAARLTLVTCAPPYVPSRGGYQNLAVVTATPLGPPEVR